jgi:hypothetical protein
MGLDLVEYVIAIENAFEIAIPHADVARLTTPAQLIEYLCARLGESADGPPLVQTAFYRLRASLAEELGLPRASIVPATVLADLTARSPEHVWAALAARLGIERKLLTHSPAAQMLGKLFPTEPRSIGALAEQLAMLRPAAVKGRGTGWTRAQVTEVVLRLLEHEIGVQVTPHQLHLTFVGDLGMG